ncbi:hypothetical protein [Paenibacillus kyungheensis]
MKKIPIIISVVILSVLLNGCNTLSDKKENSSSGNTATVMPSKDYEVSDTELKNLIKTGIQNRLKQNIEVENITLDYPYYEDQLLYSTFIVKAENNTELGFLTANYKNNKYHLNDINLFPVDAKKPFEVVSFIGKVNNGERNYKALLGYINNKDITEVRTHYTDGTINSIKLKPENHTFLDVVTGRNVTEKSVEARDKNDKIIYKQDY